MTVEMAHANGSIDPRLMTQRKALLLAVEVLRCEAASERTKALSDSEEQLDQHYARCGELARAAGYLHRMAVEPAKIDARGAQNSTAVAAAVLDAMQRAKERRPNESHS